MSHTRNSERVPYCGILCGVHPRGIGMCISGARVIYVHNGEYDCTSALVACPMPLFYESPSPSLNRSAATLNMRAATGRSRSPAPGSLSPARPERERSWARSPITPDSPPRGEPTLAEQLKSLSLGTKYFPLVPVELVMTVDHCELGECEYGIHYERSDSATHVCELDLDRERLWNDLDGKFPLPREEKLRLSLLVPESFVDDEFGEGCPDLSEFPGSKRTLEVAISNAVNNLPDDERSHVLAFVTDVFESFGY